ncbi:MAG: hypothetical protein AAGK17_10175 [Pseudomonadota bacterium]
MSRAMTISGGAAAIIAASAVTLFPPFDDVSGVASPSAQEFSSGRKAFARFMTDPQNDVSQLKQMGLSARAIEGADGTVLASESDDECKGRGIYWLRDHGGTSLAITAPHRGSDRHTGTLASALFLETEAKVAAWNSAPRRANDKCPYGLDLARERHHLFSAFNLGFADAAPDGLIVQLHGFEGERRHSQAARDAGIIVSDGTQKPGTRLYDFADCLSIAFAPAPVLVYPGDTAELGALTNAQGQLLRENGFDGFVHLEISAPLREAMVEDGALRAKLAGCLRKAAG